MKIGIGLGISQQRASGGGGGGPVAPFQSVNADGWSVTAADPVAAVGQSATVQRQGFSGITPTTINETVPCTTRVRNVWPNDTTLTADRVALAEYLLSTDTIAGVTNSSTEVSPKPVANWVLPDDYLVGDTLYLEVCAGHYYARNSEQVAAVEITVSDGTTTLTQVVTQSVISGREGDVNPLPVYAATINVGALANPSTLTVNARVFPHVGGASSVLNSVDQSEARQFSPRRYRRDTARFAAPPLAYVNGVGGGTPTVSTDPAVAAANPFATIVAAIAGLKAATGVTGGRIDGCEIRLTAATHVFGDVTTATATGAQDQSHVVITAAPGVARQDAIVSFGAAAAHLRTLSRVTLRNVSILRTGVNPINSTATETRVVLDLVRLTCAGNTTALIAGANHLYVYGMVCIDNVGPTTLTAGGAAGATQRRCFRGLDAQFGGNIENWLIVASRLTGDTNPVASSARSSNGLIWLANTFEVFSTGNWRIGDGLQETLAAAVIGNTFAFLGTTSAASAWNSADSGLGIFSQFVFHHNTLAGFWNHGRSNMIYDEHPTIARSHKFVSDKANIHVSLNTKGDRFISDGTRLGNFAYTHGVGCRDNVIQFAAASTNFEQEFIPLNSVRGTSTTVRLDPLFVNDNSTPDGVTLGTTNGDYSLQSSSPAKNRARALMRFDLAGVTRTATTSSGAYQ